MTADVTIEATPGQVAAIERDGFLATAGPTGPTFQAVENMPMLRGLPVPTTKPCPECGGEPECPECGDDGTNREPDWPDCHFCKGEPCPTCNGDGTVPITVEVVVPPRGHCPAGWAATTEDVCNCTGGHYCVRPRGHDSKQHRCACGVTTTRQDALPSPDEEGPARTLLRGTAEAVPVADHAIGSDCLVVAYSDVDLVTYPEDKDGYDDPYLIQSVTHHFADVPRPEVGDTAWIIRGEG